MKFDCGETWPEKCRRLTQWHRWFAWYPIQKDDHDCRWLEYVERCGKQVNEGQGDWSWKWTYRDVKS